MRRARKSVPSPLTVGLRRLHLPWLVGAITLCTAAATAAVVPGSAAAGTCGTSVMAFVAHEDDSLLFLSPDLLHDIQAGDCVTQVYLTAGDDGNGAAYWQAREAGANAGFANMAGVADNWSQGGTSAAGHSIVTYTLQGAPNIKQVFLRLPDGNVDGSGFALYNYESLLKLWTGVIGTIHPVDGSPSYTAPDVVATLTSLMNTFQPSIIRTQDYAGYVGDDDHADHVITAYFTRAASQRYTTAHTLIGYMGYDSQYQPQNVSGADLTDKQNAFSAYTQYSPACDSPCTGTDAAFLARQYVTASESAPTPNQPPTANAGPNETVIAGVTVSLNGSGSSDPNGDLLSYQWTQTAGPTVTLSDPTSPRPTFTAPASSASLAFQLVVNDGQISSAPSSVTITVSESGGADVAMLATATASSQNTAGGQTPAKAIDGIVSGYPYNSGNEWATNGGVAGSWLTLTWSSSVTLATIILHDRPNLNDQITSATLTFSNGTHIAVGALPNDGSPLTVTVPDITTTTLTLTVNSVSSTTQNVGLAEIEAWTPVGTSGSLPPTADAGTAQTVLSGATVTLDGSGSSDPNGESLTYQWTQTAGPSVTLSSPTAVKPTFTAPASSATLTFQLVVSDAQLSSAPSSVTISVTQDLAMLATATASSQNTATGQTAAKAIDGVVDGYPGDATKEWATNGGVAGSWLTLTWSSPVTLATIVLYDRPNLNDQITSATLTFSNGTHIAVGALPNDGSPLTVTVPDITTTTTLTLTVNSVSSTTQNVGLAEIEAFG